MKISKVRRGLYRTAKYLGDAQAVEQAAKKGSVAPIAKRAKRRLIGKLLGRL